MMECLNNVVGVTKADSECLTGGLDAETLNKLKVSVSGLYMDDLPGGVHLKALRHIDTAKSMADLSLTARDNAIKTMEDDLLLKLNEKYRQGRRAYVGNIGRASYTSALPAGRRWEGIRIRPTDGNDAVINLSRVQCVFSSTVAVPVTFYIIRAIVDGIQGETIQQFTINAPANAYAEHRFSPALELPTRINNSMDNVEYWIVYDTTVPGIPYRPKDTKIGCASCNSVATDILAEYVKVYGVTLNDINRLDQKTQDDYSHGIILDVDLRCETASLFCREYTDDNAIAVAMARAVWYKSGELLIEEVLKSPDVNRYTTMQRETLYGKRNHFRAEYDQRIVYLADSIDVTASNCYVCRQQNNQPFFSGIYS